jgi:hypothetical protein
MTGMVRCVDVLAQASVLKKKTSSVCLYHLDGPLFFLLVLILTVLVLTEHICTSEEKDVDCA